MMDSISPSHSPHYATQHIAKWTPHTLRDSRSISGRFNRIHGEDIHIVGQFSKQHQNRIFKLSHIR